MSDIAYMRAALALARRGLGTVWPNPTVGCVLVKDGAIVGRGWTQPGGRPHGETVALERAGEAARGATAYVSLEPCCHWGKTPPCTDALIAAGVSRVVVPIEDPDPRVSGQGIARLQAAGISVTKGICAEEARDINAGFFLKLHEERPLVTLKLATTLDGKIAMADGESKWITGSLARDRGHLLRATHDAVMIGSNTAVADDPQLTCRLSGLQHRTPVRVVVDSRLRLPLTSKLVAEAGHAPTWLITRPDSDSYRREAFQSAGVDLIEVPATEAGVDLRQAMRELAQRGVTRVLVEGGAVLAAQLVRLGLVDRIAWFRAPKVIGEDGRASVASLGLAQLAEAPAFERVSLETIGEDVLETLKRSA